MLERRLLLQSDMRATVVFLLAVGCGSSSISSNPTDSGVDAPLPRPALAVLTAPTLAAPKTPSTKAFWGDVIVIRATGLLPAATITLRATELFRDGKHYQSWATFTASAAGDVDTSRDTPTEGTWTGVDPDGLTWSMLPIDAPADPIADKSMRIDLEIDGARAARTELARYLLADPIEHVVVNEGGLVGAYYAPKDGKRHPAILAFGGSEGGLSTGEYDATYYSALGYAVLGVAYFGAEGVPDALQQIPLEYFEKAMTWLDGRPEADATKLAVMGGSRGGELAILLGATYPRIKAVIAQVPSGVVWGAPQFDGSEFASWTLAGKDVPFVPSLFDPGKTFKDTDGKLLHAYDVTFVDAMKAATPEQIDLATPRVEKTAGPVLMLAGADDRLWAACTLSKPAVDRLKAAGHDKAHGSELLCFPDAGHNVRTPGAPTFGSHRIQHPISKQWLALGGTPAGVGRANRLADTRIRAVLAGLSK